MQQLWHSSHALVAIPLGLIVVITVVDIQSPQNIHLGPLLVIAPALAASFSGPWTTALIGALAVAAQVVIAVLHGGLTTSNHVAQIIALSVLSVFVVLVCMVRERRKRELAQVRSVSEAAQRALLRPLPHRLGPLRFGSSYLAAEEEACIGGDLYAVTRTDSGTRVIIGDVRGKGLASVGEAATLLGAFQEAAHQHTTLPALASALDRSVCRYLTHFPEGDEEAPEHFITALLLEIPDHEPVARMTHCGHPPPLLVSQGGVTTAASSQPAPPLGMCGLGPDTHALDEFAFQTGDTLLLYTDGVIEARDRNNAFYPLAQRVAQWTRSSPDALVQNIQRDLLAHAEGSLGDDAALLAIQRMHSSS
ncbi:PP2C family protein-serine/threonine phosphatase [Streptomyces gilvosporeus]|uniref:Protein phosphatase n=1 Tax=Streptomyces gilvosporeus TaxID=553510 RepID=A0A1V0U0Q5_9ACTN|nr:PP2C family protein-serine/threonine phosphatase [Streptomyces gilvosporeus]ARF58756.1 protein phosphatase [Streptomyces gilvosporeus]